MAYFEQRVSTLYESGSNWRSEHVNALHAHRFENIPLERFFQGCMLDDNDEGMSQRIKIDFKTVLIGWLVSVHTFTSLHTKGTRDGPSALESRRRPDEK